ncbi:hypothetical protein A7A08_00612 [Methyloligella halotolerans]|uniref:Phasin protein n=1 Tax=Methyloligella halotolerans TaxID=1177755 RepID=A0A1E2S372_9HYPH|nr:hypothetical protein [Methyloligella halotolerans]ODA68778.1 hypothetical protein A7A08_00612 [Methyloligella halotolerans]
MAIGAALSFCVLALSLSLAASPLLSAPAEQIEHGADATADALAPEGHDPSSFEAFAVETLQRLNDGAARLQRQAENTVRSFGISVTESAERMDDAWEETLEKFGALRSHAKGTYEALEGRTLRAIDAFERWLAGDRALRPTPLPATPERIEGEGPAIPV